MGDQGSVQTKWDAYVNASISLSDFTQTSREKAFDAQRDHIGRLVHALQPETVACLGSGFLNDLPVETLFQTAQSIFFVDWIRDLSFEGVRRRAIQSSPNLRCLFCECDQPDRFCQAFSGRENEADLVCRSYCRFDESTGECDNYVPGTEPHFVQADVTAGRSSHFGTRVAKIVAQSDSLKQAFRRATREARNCAKLDKPMPLDADSFDFATSSLVASQFDVEPFTFFAVLLEEKFGREAIAAKEEVMKSMMEELRGELFRLQMEGHASELYRVLSKPDGRAYFSVEFFRNSPNSEDFFLVQESPAVLDSLGRYFLFDFAASTPEESLRALPMGNGRSVVQSFVLKPRPEPLAA